MPIVNHPVLALSEAARVDYLTAVASLALADGAVDERELSQVGKLCAALELSPAGEKAVLAGARTNDRAAARAIVARMGGDPILHASLLTDALVIAFADGRVDRGEIAALSDYANLLGVAPAQLTLMARYVALAIRGDAADEGETMARDLAVGLEEMPGPGLIQWVHKKLR